MTDQKPKINRTNLKRLSIRKPRAVAVALVVSLVGAYFIINSLAVTGTDSLSVLPATSSVGVGNNITVTVTENSGSDIVNAVQANLTYSSNLQFVSVDYSTSPFDVAAVNTKGSGTINISRGIISYNTGTISQSGTTITGSGTSFDSSLVGKTITYADGSTATVSAFTDATQHATKLR